MENKVKRSPNKKITTRFPKRNPAKNALMDELFNNPYFGSESIFYTVRDKEIAGYNNGVKIFTLKPDKDLVIYEYLVKGEKKDIQTIFCFDNIKDLRARIEKDIDSVKRYLSGEEGTKVQKNLEKHFQHYLLFHINEIESLKEEYGEIQIVDFEFIVFCRQNNLKDSIAKHGNAKARVDILATSTKKNCILYIEIKYNDGVIQGDNGMNKHFFDIYDSYFHTNMNEFIESQSKIFNRNLSKINDRKVEFITICGYTKEGKDSTISNISELMSWSSVRKLKEGNNVQLGKGKENDNENVRGSVHPLQKHMQILARPVKKSGIVRGESRIFLAEVDNNYAPIKVDDITCLFEDDAKYMNKDAAFHKDRIINYIENRK